MSWEIETDPDRIAAVLRTPIVGVRTVNLAEPGGTGFDMMPILEAITGGDVSNVDDFLKKSRKAGEDAGVYRQYELQIHKHPLPYVSIYERCQRKHVAMFLWSFDTEPLHTGDERMHLLACKLDEHLWEQTDEDSG